MRNFIKKFKTYSVSPFGWLLLVAFSAATYYDGGISNVITLWIFAPILYFLAVVINIFQEPFKLPNKVTISRIGDEEDGHDW